MESKQVTLDAGLLARFNLYLASLCRIVFIIQQRLEKQQQRQSNPGLSIIVVPKNDWFGSEKSSKDKKRNNLARKFEDILHS